MYEENNIHVVKPPKTKKYKKFCKMIYNIFHKKFIKKKNNKISINVHILMNILIDHLKENKDISYARNVKYTQNDFVEGIIDIINNNTYWNRYKGKVPGKYLNKKHGEYCKMGVYECLYMIIVMIYFKEAKFIKLKHQSIDTTFIRNLYGKEMIQRNVQYKSKNGIKVSSINDTNGVAISFAISKGSTNDAKIALSQLNTSFIDLETKRVNKNKRYKQNIYMDAMYHDTELLTVLKNKGYKPTTDVNIRNTKNKTKLKQLKLMKEKYLKVCKKRYIVEASFAWLHKFPKLDRFVEKTIKSYKGLLLLGSSITVSKKIN